MAPSAQDKIQQQSKEELDRIARVSLDIRRAVIAALPAPPEQFFTMMVPGKVLNFEVRRRELFHRRGLRSAYWMSFVGFHQGL